jgi:intein/homing endonuclease
MVKEISLKDLIEINPKLNVELKRDEITKIKKQIISKYEKYDNFCKVIGFSTSMLSQVLAGKRNPNVTFVQKTANNLDIKVEDFISKIFLKFRPFGSYIPIEAFPIKFTPELASLVGHSFGDGYVGSTFSYTNLSEELIDNTMSNIEFLPIKNTTINKWYHKALTIRPSRLIKDILIIAGAPKGNKILQETQIPKWIMNGKYEFKKKFLQALFDDEGSVLINKREIELAIAKNIKFDNNLKEFLDKIKILLNNIGIEGITITLNGYFNGKNGKTVSYKLRICGVQNFINFRKKVGFLHPKKSQFLDRMIDSSQHLKLSKEKRDTAIMRLLRKRPMLTSLEISKSIGMTHIGTIDKLRDMEKRSLLIRYGKYKSKWEVK